jgi:hypothetical protein
MVYQFDYFTPGHNTNIPSRTSLDLKRNNLRMQNWAQTATLRHLSNQRHLNA